MATERILSALAALVPDQAITRIAVSAANGDGGRPEVQLEVTRGRRVTSSLLPAGPDELREFISALLGPDQLSGAVSFQVFAGIAALQPVADAPLLLLQRRATTRVTPETVVTDGLLTAEVSRLLATLLARGSGVILTGPSRSRLGDVLSALAQLLPTSVAVAAVETGSRIDPSRATVRLRALPASARRGLGDAVLLIDLPDPPPLSSLTPPVAIAVTAKTAVGALARLRPCGIALTPADAIAWADITPLLVRYVHTPLGPRLESVWELQGCVDGTLGLPSPRRGLTMLFGTDPGSGSLVPTGAIPLDPVVRSAWDDAGGRVGRHGQGLR